MLPILLYKRILKKLDLSADQLWNLGKKMTSRYICAGPFIRADKMCPNTTALSIKEGGLGFKDPNQIRKLFKIYNISSLDLWLFYFLFDMLASISKTFFERSLLKMRTAVDEILAHKS